MPTPHKPVQQSRDDLQRLFRDIPIGLMVVDAQGHVLDVNQYCVEMAGFASIEASIGYPSFDLFVERDNVLKVLQQLVHKDRLQNLTMRIRKLDGEERWVRNDIIAKRDDSGTIIGYEAAITDVSKEQHYLTLIELQRTLTQQLSHCKDAGEACYQIVQFCLTLPGVDCGGIYLLTLGGERMELVNAYNLGDNFLRQVAQFPSEYPQLLQNGILSSMVDLPEQALALLQEEEIRGYVLVPMEWQGRLIGCINLATHTREEIPALTIEFLELAGSQLAATLDKLRQLRHLQHQEIFYRTMFQESPVGMVSYDFTNLRKELELLQNTEEDPFALLQDDDDTFLRVIRLGNLLSVNNEFVHLIEAENFEVMRDDLRNHLLGTIRKDTVRLLQEMYNGRTRYEFETTLRTRQGRLKNVYVRCNIVPGQEKTWSRVLLSILDVTILSETIDALRDSLLYNRGLLLAIPDMYIVFNRKRIIIDCKPPAAYALSTPVSSLVGSDITALQLQDDEFEALSRLLGQTLSLHKPHFLRLHFGTEQGVRSFDAGFTPLGNHDILMIARDTTENERLMHKRLEAESNLLRNLHMQEMLALVASNFNRADGTDLDEQMALLGEAMQLDVIHLFQLHGNGMISITNEWITENGVSHKAKLQNLPSEPHKWWLENLQYGKAIAISDTTTKAVQPEMESCLLEHFNIRAMLVMGVFIRNEMVGYVSFGYIDRPHVWSQQERQVLHIFTELITNWLTREQTVRAMQESEEQFRNLAEKSPHMIFINQQGRVVYANQECERLMGYTREEFYSTGFDFFKLIAPSSREQVQQNFMRHLQGEDISPYEYRLLRRDGTIFDVILASKIISYRNKPAIMGIITDISSRKAMETQLRRTNEDLEQFVYVASHDLQEPLRGISSYMELLQDQYADHLEEKGRLFVQRAGLAAQRLQKMIDGLLAYSRVAQRVVSRDPVDMNQLIEEVVGTMPAVQQASLRCDHLPIVHGDALLLQSVWRNLLSNAVKYCETKPALHIGYRHEDGNHVIWLRDNGIGIREEYLEEVFEIFRRLNAYDRYPGSGIGLATCRKIVESHGGSIRVESTPGEGSTFIVTLPVYMVDDIAISPEKP